MNDDYGWESEYKDKFGRPIGSDELEILLRNREYSIVKQDIIGNFFISTVWLGVPLDMGIYFFETVVFGLDKKGLPNYEDERDCDHYTNMRLAEVGHEKMINKWRDKTCNACAVIVTTGASHESGLAPKSMESP